jgi:hypothetical protein
MLLAEEEDVLEKNSLIPGMSAALQHHGLVRERKIEFS